jgi:probable HAF family extracellular repeat protein
MTVSIVRWRRCFLLLLFGAANLLAQTYTITDLGVLPGDDSSYGRCINGMGQIAGNSFSSSNHAFLWTTQTGMQDLGTLPGFDSSTAFAINKNGVVAGYSFDSQTQLGHAFVSIKSRPLIDLGTLPGGSSSVAFAINSLPNVAGYSDTPDSTSHAVIWTPDRKVRDLGVLANGSYSYATGMNDQNYVVGISDALGGQTTYGFLWTPSTGMKRLPGALLTEAWAINSSGVIAGDGVRSDFTQDAVLWTPDGKIHHLGVLSGFTATFAYAINGSGQVVGELYSTSVIHAMLWTAKSGMQDLNNLIPSGSGWLLTSASGINDAGQITGGGSVNGQSHAFLLTPTKRISNSSFP